MPCFFNLFNTAVWEIPFREKDDIIMQRRQSLPYHPNGMRFSAYDGANAELYSKVYYSVGGGFVVDEKAAGADRIKEDDTSLPYPFKSAKELLQLCTEHGLPISQLILENEKVWRSEPEIRRGLLNIWDVMQACVRRGCEREGTLPGGLKIRRRAADLYRKLCSRPERPPDHLGLGGPLRLGGQRRKRGGRTGRHSAYQWRRRHYPGSTALP